jgi:DNA-binding IclR family transcriptional regulator
MGESFAHAIKRRRIVHVDEPFHGPHGVGWASIGTVTPSYARAFGRAVIRAADEAERLDKVKAAQLKCKHSRTSSTWFEGNQERKLCLDCGKVWWD